MQSVSQSDQPDRIQSVCDLSFNPCFGAIGSVTEKHPNLMEVGELNSSFRM